MSRWRKAALKGLLLVAVAYGLLAYVVLPLAWERYEYQPGLADRPMVTRTSDGIPGDPLNVGLVGSEEGIFVAMHAAGWLSADPLTLRSAVEIVGSVLLDRPYVHAPVSPLFLEGRREDFAFEKPVGESADRRHHVRLWKVLESGEEGRPVWLGAVTFDRGVGLSHDTGQITHHIAPDIDTQRDLLIGDLAAAGKLKAIYQVSGIGPTLYGRNGGGDPYYSDGELVVGRLVAAGEPDDMTPQRLPAPAVIELKNTLWPHIAAALAGRAD
jgi:hypothetical protein